jgi:hypothetical protein
MGFMDLTQGLIVDAGWVFFTIWGAMLVVLSLAAFGKDLLQLVLHPAATELDVKLLNR